MVWFEALFGPQFLAVFWGLTLGGFGAVWLCGKSARGPSSLLPLEGRFSPVQLAFLRDQYEGMRQVALFELWQRNALVIEGRQGEYRKALIRRGAGEAQNPVETVLLDFLQEPIEPVRVLTDPGLWERLRVAAEPLLEPMRREALVLRVEEVRQAQERFWRLAFALTAFGGFGTMVHLQHGRPFAGIVISLGLLWLMTLVMASSEMRTRRGLGAIAALQQKYHRTRANPEQGSLDLGLFVALFGTEDFPKRNPYLSFERAFAMEARRPYSLTSGPSVPVEGREQLDRKPQ